MHNNSSSQPDLILDQLSSPEHISQNNNPQVSIIFTVRNQDIQVPHILEYLFNQTLPEIEIIAIDRHSNDQTVNFLKYAQRQDQRIQIIESNSYISKFQAYVTGVKRARGQYIMFADEFGRLKLDACEIAYREIFSKKADALEFSSYIINDSEIEEYEYFTISQRFTPEYIRVSHNRIIQAIFYSSLFSTTLWNKIYNASKLKFALDKAPKNLDTEIYEDKLLSALIYPHVQVLWGMPLKLCYWNYHPALIPDSELSPNKFKKAMDDCVKTIELLKQCFSHLGSDDQFNALKWQREVIFLDCQSLYERMENQTKPHLKQVLVDAFQTAWKGHVYYDDVGQEFILKPLI